VSAAGLPYILVVDGGSGGALAAARAVRRLGAYSEIVPAARAAEAASSRPPRGAVVVAGPEAETAEAALRAAGLPVMMVDGASVRGEPSEALASFVEEECRCAGTWTMAAYAASQVEAIRARVGEGRVVCALSGGVDSAVAATLVHRAIGQQLVCVFVDHGFMRKGEPEQVVTAFRERGMNLVHVEAQDRFLSRIAGITDPEEKRKRIGREFIAVFEEEARRIGDVAYLVQGTVYPDVAESGAGEGRLVKSHHNVGGLPETMTLQLIEPLRQLFKDEVRALGRELGLPDAIVQRQPFPGPGLALRVIGEVTRERLHMAREADHIVVEEIARAGLTEVWQSFAVLTNTRTVGVQDGGRTYGHLVAVRAVTSVDGTEARWARLPWDVLDRIARRITAEVPGVNRVVYDISSKPPASIEWE